jgi:L-threonylcarbamoyladenylate synthase
LNPDAVARIYAAKKRPLDNPVIVHVSSRQDITELVEKVSAEAMKLIKAFWPGPLTLVLKASARVPEATTGGLDTVAVRMPDHRVALALIRESGVPIAAPSANLSGRPSPTTADHVRQDLEGRIEMILDCGPTRIGVESTVLDLTAVPPQILRPGGVPYEDIKRLLGKVVLHPSVETLGEVRFVKARSPGMKHRHYAPRARLIVVEGKTKACTRKVQEIADAYGKSGRKVGILATDEKARGYRADVVKSLGARGDLESVARNLFRLLREFDEEQVDVIVAEAVPLKGLGLAVMNRLRKASGFNIVKAY